jgi:hypothetical protein
MKFDLESLSDSLCTRAFVYHEEHNGTQRAQYF